MNLAESVIIRSQIGIGPRGQGPRLVIGKTQERAEPNDALRTLLARAHDWRKRWFAEPEKTLAEIVNDANMSKTEVSRALPFTFLAPDILTALLNGGSSITAKELRRLHDLPASWVEQCRLLGVAAPQPRQ